LFLFVAVTCSHQYLALYKSGLPRFNHTTIFMALFSYSLWPFGDS
jgi:hypothetical protein